MEKTTILFLIFIFFPTLVFTNSWEDPYFEDAIKDAGLICTGIVESSSEKITIIRIKTVYKGKQDEEDIVKIYRAQIVGLGHEKETLNKGQMYLFILEKINKKYVAYTDTYWAFPIKDSQIIIPIRDPLSFISINRPKFDTLLKLIIENKTIDDAQDFTEICLKELMESNPLTKKVEEVESQVFNLEVLHYFGKQTQSSHIVKYMESPYYQVRWSCIRALTTCGGLESKIAILNQLDKEESAHVQSVLGKAVFQLNIKEAQKIIESQIPELSKEEVSIARELMNPIKNRLPSPRYSYGAALMKINGVNGTYEDLLKKSEEYIAMHPNIKLDILEGKENYYSISEAIKNPDSVFILTLGLKSLTEIPDEIRNFKNLKKLSLYRNKIKIVPAFIAEMNLTELDLSENELETIPDVVFSCKTLKVINLSSNNLKKIDPRLYLMTNLEELYLGSNSIKEVSRDIANLKNLKILNFRINKIDSLPVEIGQLKKLKEIELYGNRFIKFPEILTECQSLKKINIASNNLKTVPESVIKMKYLKNIDFSYNPISLTERARISAFQSLVIVNTNTYEDRYYSVIEALENPIDSKIIHDENNDYSKLNIDLSELQFTEYLVFTHNQLVAFPNGITNMRNLQSLNLSYNEIKEIPEDIAKLKKLNRLELSNNNLTKLPDSIKELNLKFMNLSNNNFSEQEKQKIEDWFRGKCKIIW